jgi:Protein of unknown function (DUF1631)
MHSDDSRIQAALDAAQKSIRAAVSDAIDPASVALKALLRTAVPSERPALTQAQAILQLSRQPLLAAFEKAMRQLVDEELAPEGEASGFHDPTDWMSVGLVDEDQFENRLAFERVGQLIGHECEAELRELTAYTGELLNAGWADPERNPMRGQLIASALYQAVESVVEGGACRRLVVRELGQALAKALASSYRGIVKDFSSRGFKQIELTARPSAASAGGASGRSGAGGGAGSSAGGSSGAGASGSAGGGAWPAGDASGPANAGLEAMRDLWEKSMLGRPLASADAARSWETSIRNPQAAAFVAAPGGAGADSSAALLERLMQEAMNGAMWSAATAPDGAAMRAGGGSSVSDADLMRLLRRLGDAVPASPHEAAVNGHRQTRSGEQPTFFGTSFAATGIGSAQSTFGALPPTNLIRAHHDELVQAASGEVDHMVIEVVAGLFDQILADTRVPPEIAREIARLQMPVLRVALRDTSFFSARKHPVRRFINRISTLATSFGAFDSGPGKELLVRVNALVSEIVEGDFDQVPLYVRKLAELEDFVAAIGRAEFEGTPAAAALQAKEAEWQMGQVFGGRLHEAYEHLPIPAYLKTFLAGVWSQAIVASAQGKNPDPAREKRFRRAAFHLVASIQPKRSAEERKLFLSGLRGLTGTLDEGLALIGWPKQEHDAFFGKLMADHSGSLKAVPGSDLDHNMLLRQLDVAARTPLPDAAEASASTEGEAFEPRCAPGEAERVGFVDEAAVDWSKPTTVVAAKEIVVPAVGPSVARESEAEAGLDLDLATRPAPFDEVSLPKAPVASSVDPDAFPTIEPPPLVAELAAAPPGPAAVAAPLPAEPDEPTEGAQLLHHLQIGVSYRLHLKDKWEKVRLTHMNASKTFFLFTHGTEDRGTISMTVRMLGRLCDTHRMKAYEDKPLLDRATDRLRTQAPAAPSAGAAAVRKPEVSAA